MKIEGVGIGSTNAIRVRREWLGTKIGTAATGDLVTKVVGNYNIVDNTLNFVEAPFGNTPIGSTTNPPDERDWTGITTSSSFQGRSFMRSGVVTQEMKLIIRTIFLMIFLQDLMLQKMNLL